MTNQQHFITPPPELLQSWYEDKTDYFIDMIRAAQWGADQELEACIDWLANARNHTLNWNEATNYSANLRAARRLKPPSLKEQALALVEQHEDGWRPSPKDWDTIRRALEQLDD